MSSADAIRVPALIAIGFETVAVIFVQTVCRCEPQKSVVILHNLLHPAMRGFPIYGELSKPDIVLVDDWQLY